MDKKLASVCIVGAGAVGLSLAWHLSVSANVKVVSKQGKDRLWQVKLQAAGEESGESRQLSVVSWDDLVSLGPFDFYLVCVKGQDQRQVLTALKPNLKATDCLVLLSNGISMFLDAVDVLGVKTSIIRGLVFYGVRKENDTEIGQAGRAAVLLASRDIDRSAKLRLGSIFETGNIAVTYEDNIARAEWKKAITSLVVNTLCTVNQCENGRLLTDPALKREAKMLLSEIDQVIRRDGFELEEAESEKFFTSIERHASNFNSTLLDYQKGRPSELPFILGRFLSLSDQYGMPVPLMRELAFRLDEMDKGSLA